MISEALLAFLSLWIVENTEFKVKIEHPVFFKLSEKQMSDKACFSSANCRVKAYYVKNDGIFYINTLDPENNICDTSIILHEMVHHYQKMTIELLILTKKLFGHFKKDKLFTIRTYFLFPKKELMKIMALKMFYNVRGDLT